MSEKEKAKELLESQEFIIQAAACSSQQVSSVGSLQIASDQTTEYDSFYASNSSQQQESQVQNSQVLTNSFGNLYSFFGESGEIQKNTLILNDIVNKIISMNKNMEPNMTDPFYNELGQVQTIQNFLEDIEHHINIEECEAVQGLMFIDKYIQKTDGEIHSFNIRRLLTVGFIIAQKICHDKQSNMLLKMYQKASGISVQVLQKLELQMLTVLDFKVYISETQYNNYYEELKGQK